MIRQRVHYSGNVQGVGFRFTAIHVASRFEVGGYVKNLSDGRVELVVEGSAGQVAAFLEALADAMNSYIRYTHIEQLAATGEFSGFEIRQ